MNDDFRHTDNGGYIQNPGDSSSRSAPVELSANVTEAFPEVSERAICIRMLDAAASTHSQSHIGVILTPEVARTFAHWLLVAAESGDETLVINPED